jgi:hypothetical protein
MKKNWLWSDRLRLQGSCSASLCNASSCNSSFAFFVLPEIPQLIMYRRQRFRGTRVDIRYSNSIIKRSNFFDLPVVLPWFQIDHFCSRYPLDQLPPRNFLSWLTSIYYTLLRTSIWPCVPQSCTVAYLSAWFLTHRLNFSSSVVSTE